MKHALKSAQMLRGEDWVEIAIGLIDTPPIYCFDRPPYEHLEQLVDETRRFGQASALVVLSNGARYELLAGHRQLRALRVLEQKAAVCRVHIGRSRSEALLLASSEARARNLLSPFERALLCRELNQYGEGLDAIGKNLGESPARVGQYLSFLEFSSKAVKEAVHARKIDFAAAFALVEARSHELGERIEREIVRMAAVHRISPREAKDLVARFRRGDAARAQPAPPGRPKEGLWVHTNRRGEIIAQAMSDTALEPLLARIEAALLRLHAARRGRPS